jgi:hypothetical protein
MPRKVPSQPPPRMTWGKALPALVIAGIFDALRCFFNLFWLFGPALLGTAAAYGASQYGGTWAGSVIGAATAGVTGYFGSPLFVMFGSVMAIAVGILGWLTVGLFLAFINMRIYKAATTNLVVSLTGLGVSIIPIVGSLPALSATVFKMYYSQIKSDKAAFKAWQIEQESFRRELARQIDALEKARALADERRRALSEEEIPEGATGVA